MLENGKKLKRPYIKAINTPISPKAKLQEKKIGNSPNNGIDATILINASEFPDNKLVNLPYHS